ncbi:hypothetical protein BDZ89DRAFT_1163674 [Hymenopellis radicata]|nr:hypothetical protein BDZ89DRAFT_1163674 [Hymenopellis radicata]
MLMSLTIPAIPPLNVNSHSGFALTHFVHSLIRYLFEMGANLAAKDAIAVVVARNQIRFSPCYCLSLPGVLGAQSAEAEAYVPVVDLGYANYRGIWDPTFSNNTQFLVSDMLLPHRWLIGLDSIQLTGLRRSAIQRAPATYKKRFIPGS